jgi:hypothetical protein
MIYVDYDYYINDFGGKAITQDDFTPLARLASDLVDSIVTVPINQSDVPDDVKRAVCYQIELLDTNGGYGAAITASGGAETERLGDYSISYSATTSVRWNYNGIPLSQMLISLLRGLGLLSTWLYNEVYKSEHTAG